jgi:hypothetical protein
MQGNLKLDPEGIGSRYRNRTQAARYLSISASYLKVLDATGRGPRRVRLGRRWIYAEADLDAFADANKVGGDA